MKKIVKKENNVNLYIREAEKSIHYNYVTNIYNYTHIIVYMLRFKIYFQFLIV